MWSMHANIISVSYTHLDVYKRQITGYVIEVTDKPEYDPARTKPLIGIKADSVAVEAKLIALAAWIRRNYGSTMNQALKTCLLYTSRCV